MTEDVDLYFADFGTEHTIAGNPVTCIEGEKQSVRSEIDGTWITAFDVAFKASDVSGIDHRETVTYDGVLHSVEGKKADESITTLTLVSPAKVGRSMDRI